MVEQSVKDPPARLLLRLAAVSRSPGIVPDLTCSCRYQCSPVPDLVAIHRLQVQNCYAGFSISSWPTRVREAHHDRGVQYYALYSAHKGVPVQHLRLVIERRVLRVAADIK